MDILPVLFTQNYEIISPLGRGAYSYAYHVVHRRSKHHFALKVVDKQSLIQKKLLQRLRNQISLQQKLEHPNIVKLFHSFEDQDSIYLVLQLCLGGQLYNYVRQEGPLSQVQTRSFTHQLTQGLFFLHSQGIIHRDLKLGNILLSQDRSLVKIADFGLAVQLQTFDQERHTLCGTPNYLSPEVLNRQPYGLSCDLWALGCVVYACVVGCPPFDSGDVKLTLDKVKHIKYKMPDKLSECAKHLIGNLLVLDPNTRLNIEQVRIHPFLQEGSESSYREENTPLSKDYTYIEYSQSFYEPQAYSFQEETYEVVAKTVHTEPDMRKAHDITVTPLNTKGLPPMEHSLKGSYLKINQRGWITVRAKKRQLEISNDGMTVIYQSEVYSIRELSKTAARLYEYARKALEAIRSKTPKISVQYKNCVCLLMSNSPCPNIEVDFSDGTRVLYQIGSEKMEIVYVTGQIVCVNPHQQYEEVGDEIKLIIDTTLESLKLCIEKDRRNMQINKKN